MSRPDSLPPPEANPRVPRPPSPRERGLGPFVWASIRMGWRWLTRMRTALYLLGLVALETLVATIVPQAPNVPSTVAAWRSGEEGPGAIGSALIDLVGGYDVYGSAPFLALLLLLFTSLTACLVPRFRAWGRLVSRSRPPRVANLDGQEHVTRLATDRAPSEALATVRAELGRRWRLREAAGDDDQVAAERGHVLREGGSLLFHTSFYVLLIGIVSGQLLGFTGDVGVVEGEAFTDTPVAYWRHDAGRAWGLDDHRGFTLALDEFTIDWIRDPTDPFAGQPTVFESAVTVTRPDGTRITDTIGGNDPLVVDGMKIHQLGWGYAVRVIVRADGEVVHDGFVTLQQTDQGFWRGAVKAPRADPDVGLEVSFWPFAPPDEEGSPVLTGAPWAEAPLLFFQGYRGDLRLDRVQNVTDLDRTGLVEAGAGGVRPSGSAALPDGVNVELAEVRRFVGFQVSNRPTVPLLLVGALLVLAGLVPALYAYRRRVWATAVPDPATGRTIVTLAGRSFQRPQAFEDEFAALARRLATSLDAGPRDGRDDASAPTGSSESEVVAP